MCLSPRQGPRKMTWWADTCSLGGLGSSDLVFDTCSLGGLGSLDLVFDTCSLGGLGSSDLIFLYFFFVPSSFSLTQ